MNTARLVHQKGHDTVIRALPLLPHTIRLVLVGDGPDETALKQLAQELCLRLQRPIMGDYVTLTGAQGGGDRRRRVLMLPTLAREVVEDGISGRIVPIGDVQAFAAALIDMCGNVERLALLGSEGRGRMASRATADAVLRDLRQLYASALQSA